jgi:MYXO-CTERM domain-containing protein
VRLSIVLVAAMAIGISSCHSTDEGGQFAQDIHVSERLVEFGQVSAGSSATQVVQVHNTGDFELVLSQVPEVIHEGSHEPFSAEATWTHLPGAEPGTASIKIAPRTYEEMTITYAPVAAEDSYAYIGLFSNDMDEAYRLVVLHGDSSVGMPSADVAPNWVDFGHVASGTTAEEIVEIQNLGDVDVDVLEVTMDTGPFEVVSQPDAPIPPGSAGEVTVQFASDGDHAIGLLIVEIDGQPSVSHAVSLSANSPGSISNSPPEIDLLEPTGPTVFDLDQDLELLAEAWDAEQPETGLFCTLESNRLGVVEQETSDPVTAQVRFVIDVDESSFGAAQGYHTLTLCCADMFNESACLTAVVSIEFPFSEDDEDGDGYSPGNGDCDDSDPTSYPSALELPDGVDNNCDWVVDENTTNSDDDGDGLSEAEGDCDDDDALTYPHAFEQADYMDNDCDGLIDEGTDFVDDDHDGLAEAMGDCDDGDPAVYHGGVEWCDDKDNDCDGETDEDCVDATTPMHLVGGIQADVVVAEPGQEVDFCLTVAAGPDATVVFDWNAGGGTFSGDTDGPCVTWVAADQVDAYTIYCQVTDVSADQSIWAFLEVTVQDCWHVHAVEMRGDCSLSDTHRGSPAWAMVLGALVLVLGIRRR